MPPFIPNEDFKEGLVTFEAGNTYDADKHGLTQADVDRFYNAAWAEVEGRDKAPERQVIGATLKVADSEHAATADG